MAGNISSKRPNIIWIVDDQHRGQALGCAGDPNLHTPNIDRMAAEGIRFTAAVAGTPLCCPFRGALLTGRYPHQTVPGHEYQLPPEQPTIAHAFQAAGYRTAYLGKWHLDGHLERTGRAAMHIVPPERRGGFDDWLGYENNNSQWDCWLHGHAGLDARNGETHYRLPGFETDELTSIFINYLQARGREQTDAGAPPFFAVLSVQPPHNLYVAPEGWMARHTPGQIQLRANVPQVAGVLERCRRDLAGYYAMIENIDWNIGRIRATLAEAGLTENTYIIFFSDHGDMHGSHGQFHKTAPWEEAIRIPFIISGGIPLYGHKMGMNNFVLNHVDIAPTTLGLAGIIQPPWMAGFNYANAWLQGAPVENAPDSAFLQLCIATRHGDSVDRPWRGVVTRSGWKYVALEHQPWLLFNLNEDPYEQVNLAHNGRFGSERRRLNDRLRQWLADTGDEFVLPELP